MRTNQQWATRRFIWQGVAQGCELIPYLPFAPSKAGDFQPEGHPTGIPPSFPGRLIHRKQLSGSGHQADCPALAVPTHVHNIQANERVQDISGQFSPNASSSARSCYKERGEEMAVGPHAVEVLDVAKDFFSPISCPDRFDEISSHLFSSLCRCIPAKLHFKSLLVCWFQSSPKSPIIQETDALDYWDFFGGKQHRGWFCGSIFAPNPAENVGSELEAAKKCLWNCFHGHCACGDRFVN